MIDDAPANDEAPAEDLEIRCPHCKKTFSSQLMAGGAERYRGFKCPHCRLFVPAARSAPTA
jgi:DNA-directed RNA polymerase subunit RPC12/RpoP